MPTLVLYARNDLVVPLAEGRLIAARIPSAQFVELDSRNHILLEHESAWERFCAAVSEFAGLSVAANAEDPAFASLSARTYNSRLGYRGAEQRIDCRAPFAE